MFVDTLQAVGLINQAWEQEVANTSSSREDTQAFMKGRAERLEELEAKPEELQGLLDEWFQEGDFIID